MLHIVIDRETRSIRWWRGEKPKLSYNLSFWHKRYQNSLVLLCKEELYPLNGEVVYSKPVWKLN